MKKKKNQGSWFGGVCFFDCVSFALRFVLGVFFLANGLHKAFGFFGGPGLVEYINVMNTSNLSMWVSYLMVFGELVGGALLVLGALSGLGALLVLPWWIVTAFSCVHGESLHSVDVLRMLPESFLVVKTIALFLTPVLLVMLVHRGPGHYALFDPCKKTRCRLFYCCCSMKKKG